VVKPRRSAIPLAMRRRGSIVEELRQRFRSGDYPTGTRIPTRRELAKELAISPVTLQRAVDRLIELGFLRARGKQGTFLAEPPPDRSRFAVVFGEEPGQGGWNRFWTTIQREADAWQDASGRHFQAYYIANASMTSRGHRRLCADVADGGLAGIFFACSPFFLAGSPIFASPLPKVCIGEVAGASSVVCLDPLPQVWSHFVGAGRRRIGAIGTRGMVNDRKRLCAEARRHGLEARPAWWLGLPVDPLHAECARDVTHLLFTGRPTERPDGLLINDDNLVPHATQGIIDAGLRVPDDVEVVAHANFPHATPAAVPCTRYGIDVRAMLGLVLDDLDRQRAGGGPCPVTVPAVFTPGDAVNPQPSDRRVARR
jgi:GntR family transcriptional regulator